MRLPWNTPKVEQLDLVDEASARPVESLISAAAEIASTTQSPASYGLPSLDGLGIDGRPLLVAIDCLDEDSGNPRTEFPEEELAEFAQTSLCAASFSRSSCAGQTKRPLPLLFGAKRLRAARGRAREVPVVIGSDAHDVYAQVAENQKRHGLSPLDLARFMRSRVDAGE